MDKTKVSGTFDMSSILVVATRQELSDFLDDSCLFLFYNIMLLDEYTLRLHSESLFYTMSYIPLI